MTITINIPAGGSKGDTTLHEFKVNHLDDTTTTDVLYVGKEDFDFEWAIQKLDDTGAITVVTYATIINNPSILSYSAAWAARVSLTYTVVSGA